ncbi:hypothetical protein DPX16_13793 [Anabarilius grahami]|uniref:Uncharacterized protein n=1 Tax=Anabarilius grahami TaxID=495550 RepID=A0A3N0XS05_ANAGA|nr:hypothetical protein DPX16_13793 [Anabarilius grahami]
MHFSSSDFVLDGWMDGWMDGCYHKRECGCMQTWSRQNTMTLTGDAETLGITENTGDRTSEHCRRNPLQFSAKPVKGAGLAMGLATATGEGDAAGNEEVVAGGAGVEVLVIVRRSALTRSRNGSGWLILVVDGVGLVFCYTQKGTETQLIVKKCLFNNQRMNSRMQGTWMQADLEQTGHDDTHWRHGDTRNHREHWRQCWKGMRWKNWCHDDLIGKNLAAFARTHPVPAGVSEEASPNKLQ